MVRSAQADVRNRDLIEKLRHQIAGLRRQRYGVSSELLDQLELALEDEEVARAATPVSAPHVRKARFQHEAVPPGTRPEAASLTGPMEGREAEFQGRFRTPPQRR